MDSFNDSGSASNLLRASISVAAEYGSALQSHCSTASRMSGAACLTPALPSTRAAITKLSSCCSRTESRCGTPAVEPSSTRRAATWFLLLSSIGCRSASSNTGTIGGPNPMSLDATANGASVVVRVRTASDRSAPIARAPSSRAAIWRSMFPERRSAIICASSMRTLHSARAERTTS